MHKTRGSTRRGYALIVVLTISMVLSIGIGTMLSYLASAEKTSARQRLNREAYYVCDGLGRVVTKATVDLLADESRFTDGADADTLAAQLRSGVTARLGSNLSGVLPDHYELDGATPQDGFDYRDVDATASFGSVAVGRFAGMSGQRRTFTYDLALKKEGGSSCKTTATVDSMRIPFGEFALFSDEDARLCPSWTATDITRTARYHINGNFDVGNVALPRTTMTGQLSTRCNSDGSSARLRFCVADRCIESGTSLAALENTNFLSTTVFSDGRRGTSELSLAITPQRAQHGSVLGASVQPTDATTTNEANFRFLVDPGFANDSDGVKSMKLAHLALIRIIDGVWYLNDGSWPGKVIWSDHEGSMTLNAANAPVERVINNADFDVGRDDLYASTSMPVHYSAVDGSPADSIVSYGVLRRLTTSMPQLWRPDGGGSGDKAVSAARAGFNDAHLLRDAIDRPTLNQTGNVLPLNVDLKELIKQLQAPPATNELSEQVAGVEHDPNNIIVWIGATWPGSLDGLVGSGDRPARAPTLAPPAASTTAHLPYAMCNAAEATATNERHCGAGNRINAVRVFNAGFALPDSMRITIASSLPMYVLGSVDRETPGSPLEDLPTTFFGAGFSDNYQLGNGPDVMFAADSITLLSDEWDDADRPWVAADRTSSVPDFKKVKLHGDSMTAYNASFLTGRPIIKAGYRSPYGLERSLRFLERYASITKGPIVTGSVLVGFRSVYTDATTCYGNALDDADCHVDQPWRHFWAAKLASGGGQPPGMPAFSLRAQGETIPDTMKFDFSFLFSRIFGF